MRSKDYFIVLALAGAISLAIFARRSSADPVSAAVADVQYPSDGRIDFAKHVQPILAHSCNECHGEKKRKASLRLDNKPSAFKGGETGPVILPGKSKQSLLIQRVLGQGDEKRMPLDRDPLPAEQIRILQTWIDQGAIWPDSLAGVKYIAPLAPRRPAIPLAPAGTNLTNPIDFILLPYYVTHKIKPAAVVEDRVYARRVYLDIIGLLPTPAQLDKFIADTRPNKRAELVKTLLSDNDRYAENFMTFWNDALRNDYVGTGYIDGGRKQITYWLFKALAGNMPYDRFVSQLVDPVPGSEGFANGIIWRGAVSASQVRELQAAQNISQVFLGINMKCNSCHDSFISDWKLEDSYGLAAIYSETPMPIYRCEKPNGKTALIKFLYPQLGTIDPNAPKPQRLKQFAALLTGREDGRFARTVVNRLWQRLMGRGLVEPVDEMDNEPWNVDLLDWLASDLADNGYDLKHTIAQILTSQAYQLPSAPMGDPSVREFTFTGPIVRRMNAEQFCDAAATLTGAWRTAPATGGFIPAIAKLPARWIWKDSPVTKLPENGRLYLRKVIDVPPSISSAFAVTASGDACTIFINGKQAARITKPEPEGIDLQPCLSPGKNVLAIEIENPSAPDKPKPKGSPAKTKPAAPPKPAAIKPGAIKLPKGALMPRAGIWMQILVNGKSQTCSDATWQWSTTESPGWLRADFAAAGWKPAIELGDAGAEEWNLIPKLGKLPPKFSLADRPIRAIWLKNDALMAALGRPNREQVVTCRSSIATTLQALEMTNGQTLAADVQQGAKFWLKKPYANNRQRIEAIYKTALGRLPTDHELQTAEQLLGSPVTQEGIEDLLWSVMMLPEFQLLY